MRSLLSEVWAVLFFSLRVVNLFAFSFFFFFIFRFWFFTLVSKLVSASGRPEVRVIIRAGRKLIFVLTCCAGRARERGCLSSFWGCLWERLQTLGGYAVWKAFCWAEACNCLSNPSLSFFYTHTHTVVCFFFSSLSYWVGCSWLDYIIMLEDPLLSALFRNILETWSVFFYAALGASSLILGGSLHPTTSHELQLKGTRGVHVEHCSHCAEGRKGSLLIDGTRANISCTSPGYQRNVITSAAPRFMDTLQPHWHTFSKGPGAHPCCNLTL